MTSGHCHDWNDDISRWSLESDSTCDACPSGHRLQQLSMSFLDVTRVWGRNKSPHWHFNDRSTRLIDSSLTHSSQSCGRSVLRVRLLSKYILWHAGAHCLKFDLDRNTSNRRAGFKGQMGSNAGTPTRCWTFLCVFFFVAQLCYTIFLHRGLQNHANHFFLLSLFLSLL